MNNKNIENLNIQETENKLKILKDNYKEILDVSKQLYGLNYISDNINILVKDMLTFFNKNGNDIYKDFQNKIAGFISKDTFLKKNSILTKNGQININKYKITSNNILFGDNDEDIKKYVQFLPFLISSKQLKNNNIKGLDYLFNFINLYNNTINPLKHTDIIKKDISIMGKEVYGSGMGYYISTSNIEGYEGKLLKLIINEFSNKGVIFDIPKGKRLYLVNNAPSGSQITNDTVSMYEGFNSIFEDFNEIFIDDKYNNYSKTAVLPAYVPIKLFFYCMGLKYIIYNENMGYEKLKEIIDEEVINNLFFLNDISGIKELYDSDIIPAFFKLKINREFTKNNYKKTEEDDKFLSLLNSNI